MASAFIPSNLNDYHKLYEQSVNSPLEFWSAFAESEFQWEKKWDTVLESDMYKARFSWFKGAKLNITSNCIDRHLLTQANKTAILWEPNSPDEKSRSISYQELAEEVNKLANALKSLGVKKGDRVCIYMPMIPELSFSLLACARIGAIHSVVFAGFSSKALADRIDDAKCSYVLCSDGSYRGEKTIDIKEIVDQAVESCDSIEKVLVFKRTGHKIDMKAGRDLWWHDVVDKCSGICPPETMDAEDPLFILYTSGSTGKPKGMVHTTAGYMVYTNHTFRSVFQIKDDDIYWCTADIGWITGHSYIVYGPLSAGATSLMFEGVPSYPDMGRFWDVVQKYKVTIFYTAPTAIRALEACSIDFVKPYDLSSLRVLGTVGEPINEEAWEWYDKNIGKHNCPIVDTWWQTETGGIMISPLAGITPLKPTFATLPLLGVQACLLASDQSEIESKKAEGSLCIKFPWPGMARTIYGNHQRFVDTYYSQFPGKYFTGDGAKRDEKGNYRITGRMDDVLIVSGHNLGTAEIENAIDEHSNVAEAAVVGYPHQIKGQGIYAFVQLYSPVEEQEQLKREILDIVSRLIGPIAKPDVILIVDGLPKTRSGKIMRRILRKIAAGEHGDLGDISTLLNPEIVEKIIRSAT